MHIKWIFLFGCLIFFLSNCENALVRRTTSGGNSGSRTRNRSGYSPKRASGVSSSKGTNYYRATTRYQPRLASAPPPPPPPPPPAALHGGNFRRLGNKRPIQPIAKPMVASSAITKIGAVSTFHSAPKVNASRPLYTAQHGNGRRNNTQQWSQTKVNASRPLYSTQQGNGRRNNTQQWPQTRTNTNTTGFGGNVRRNNTQQWPQMRPTFNATRVGSNFRNTSLNAFPYNTRPNTNFTRNATHIGAGGRSSTPAQVTTNEIIPKKVNASRPLYTAQHGNGRRNNTQQWSQTKVNASRPLYSAQQGNGRRNNTQQWPQTRTNTNTTGFGGNVRRNNTQQWPQMRPTFNATRVGSNFRNTSLNAFPYNTRPNTNFTRNATHIGAGGRSSTPAQVTTNEIIPKVFVGSQNSAPPPSNPSININVNVPDNGQQNNPEKSNKKSSWVSQAWKGIKDKFNSNPKKETRTTITHSLAKGPSNHVVETFADYSWDDVNADVRLAGTTKSAQKSITNKILIFSGSAVLVLLAVSLIAYFYARNRRSADLN